MKVHEQGIFEVAYENFFFMNEVFKDYTANFYSMKTTGTGNYGVPAGKTCTIYGKEL